VVRTESCFILRLFHVCHKYGRATLPPQIATLGELKREHGCHDGVTQARKLLVLATGNLGPLGLLEVLKLSAILQVKRNWSALEDDFRTLLLSEPSRQGWFEAIG